MSTRAEICKHSTGHIGAVAVYTRPTCPNMHIIKGKYVTARTNCKECRFEEFVKGERYRWKRQRLQFRRKTNRRKNT